MLAYRDWTIKKWGAKQYAKLENHGNFVATSSLRLLSVTFRLEWYFVVNIQYVVKSVKTFLTAVFCLVLDVETCEQDLARLLLVSVEDQRDTSSPLSADSSSSSPVFLPSPQHHSSSSSACSLSSSGSDIVRPKNIFSIH